MKEGTVDIFDAFFKSREECIHTCLPGKINNYDSTKRKATVKPLVKIKNKNGSIIDIPAISDVPVVLPSGQSFSLTWDIKKGDGCLLWFAETGIGNFLNSSGQVVEADDMSRFSLTDAICTPGLFPFSSVPESSLSIEGTSDYKLIVQNQQQNLATLIKDLIIQIKALQIAVSGSTGVVNPASQTALEVINQRFALLLKE